MIAHPRNGLAVLHDLLVRRRGFLGNAEGSTAVEYGLIAAFVVVAVIVALVQVREDLLGLPFPALIAAFTEALP